MITFAVHLVALKKGNPQFSKYLLLIFIIRNLLPFFDLENNRDKMNNIEIFIYLFQNIGFITVQLTLIVCLH